MVKNYIEEIGYLILKRVHVYAEQMTYKVDEAYTQPKKSVQVQCMLRVVQNVCSVFVLAQLTKLLAKTAHPILQVFIAFSMSYIHTYPCACFDICPEMNLDLNLFGSDIINKLNIPANCDIS